MPVWEDEAPLNNRQYDIDQNDYDVYHEIQGDEVLFWEDLHPDRESKVFFYEQLKILTKYIKEANPKIRTNREVFKQEVKEWNDLYDKQFISKTTDITKCSTPRAEQLKLLKAKAKCNKWGPWVRNNNCPTCGDGSRQEKRYCYTYNKSRKFDSFCKNGFQVPPHRTFKENYPTAIANSIMTDQQEILPVEINVRNNGVDGLDQTASGMTLNVIVNGGETVITT